MTTRWAVLSDTHANLAALRAVLDDAERRGADRILHLGDLVGYGGWPDETVALLQSAGAVGVAGNHDLIATDRLCADQAGRLAQQTLAWTRKHIAPETVEALAGLPTTAVLDEALLAHGSPEDPEEYVRSRSRATALLEGGLPAGTRLLLVGHTHVPWAVSLQRGVLLTRGTGRLDLDDGPQLLNPGSVGQTRARSLDARYLLLDRTAGTADFIAVAYDVHPCDARLAALGLPLRTYQAHLRPHRRLAEGLLRRVAARTSR